MRNRKLVEGELEALLARSGACIAMKTLASDAPVDYVPRKKNLERASAIITSNIGRSANHRMLCTGFQEE
jgi:hypothetical protein